MSGLAAIGAVLRKELMIEWRAPNRLLGLFWFALGLLLMLAFAMPGRYLLPDVAGGAIWIGLLLASVLGLEQSFRVELDNGALEGLILWPVPPWSIFYGKALANALILLVVSVPITALTFLLYAPDMRGSYAMLALVTLLGSLGLAAPGTLLAAMTSQARGTPALLPMLFFPVVVTVVLGCGRATSLIIEGDPMGQVGAGISLLVLFACAMWLLCGILFTFVVDRG